MIKNPTEKGMLYFEGFKGKIFSIQFSLNNDQSLFLSPPNRIMFYSTVDCRRVLSFVHRQYLNGEKIHEEF